jgi:hypothetical protein
MHTLRGIVFGTWIEQVGFPRGFVNFSAGLGDVFLLGQGQATKELWDIDGGVDRSSDAYGTGEITGTIALVVVTAGVGSEAQAIVNVSRWGHNRGFRAVTGSRKAKRA